MTARIPDLLIEKVHLGEATDAERALVLADPAARARLEALPAQDAAFLSAFPADEELRRIEGRARTAAARSRSGNRQAVWSAVLAPLLAVAVAVVWVQVDPTVAEYVATKGDELPPKLRVYKDGPGGAQRLGVGSVARAGDVVQLGVVPGSAEYGMVLSIDGRGAVTVHWPPGGQGPTALGDGETQLPTGYQLDDAPEFERFILVTTEQGPIDVEGVVRAAERLARSDSARTGPLGLPKLYAQTGFVLRKESR